MGVEIEDTGVRAPRRQPISAARHLLATNALLRHNTLLLGSTVITGLFSYLFHPIVGQLLGNIQYATVVSLTSLFGLLLTPAQIFITVFNKFTADLTAQGRPDQINYLLRLCSRYAFIVGVLVMVAVTIFSPSLAAFLKLSSPVPVIIMGISVIWGIAGTITNGAVQGRQEFGWIALTSFIGIVLRVALTAALIVIGLGVNGAILGLVLGSTVGYALSLWPLRGILRGPTARVPSLRPLFTYSLATLVAAVGGGLLFNIDTLLAKHYLTPTDASYYVAIVTIGRIVIFVTASSAGVMFPKVAALQQQGGNYRPILAWTLAATFALSIGVLGVFWLFPGHIIALILRTPPSPQIAGQLVWYGLAMLMYSLSTVLTTYFMSLGRMAFVWLVLACAGLQSVLITVWHASVGQIVLDMDIVTATLLGGAVAFYAWQEIRARRRLAMASVVSRSGDVE